MEMKSCIEHYIGSRYGLEVVVREPREMAMEAESRDIHVDKWQIVVITAPGQRHIPRQKTGEVPWKKLKWLHGVRM